ncbi:stage II sporulation protein M [Desulfonispora thiosulfatigenes DSM 11270]|uniref:Stage II sporulation protein M n=1 Tax=Desulfonispora thiosulfatigenes DSM 11270 TaxID=656914 RepID=A0A1W1VPE0_DESTI|nr:stage II sporulation protein M [Desulfonispora thiosulfatigenes]SMB95245.1 stage II sporulation protein M [Desulfonispora thiosulfatigenes DSM 11270]
MKRLVKLDFKKYFRNNYIIIILVFFFFVMGIFFGSMGVNVLSDSQITNLQSFMDNGIKNIDDNYNSQVTIKYAILRNLQTLAKVWFLGLTVIGLPLILIIIFTRGFILGFTVGFLIKNKALEGLMLILLTVLPQNIINIPALIIAGILAVNFCVYLVKGNKNNAYSLIAYFIRYTVIMLSIAVIMIGAGIIEGYVIPLTSNMLK